VLAFALNLDPAFVGGHHLARIIGLNLFSPLWRRSGRRWRQAAAGPPTSAS
jgi:hypothetical protein